VPAVAGQLGGSGVIELCWRDGGVHNVGGKDGVGQGWLWVQTVEEGRGKGHCCCLRLDSLIVDSRGCGGGGGVEAVTHVLGGYDRRVTC
jgi:hypothetical protein